MNDATHAIESSYTDVVVENLVTQFADPWDSIRELVQNSLDAGTSRIEVWCEYLRGEGRQGTIAIHVDDYGDGMDENIIDNQLTRLFASNKEGDLTKIGKFGIGFVSIFALQPRAVVLNTGRGGEYWEVFFHADRSFSKTHLDDPVEGTQITVFLEGDATQYSEASANVQRTLRKWCKHSETEILFEDRSLDVRLTINEPFELEGLESRHFECDDGTQFVMAFTATPTYEFYNRGLTLAATTVADNVMSADQAFAFRNVAFKVKSRYLEHTLSRDTVMRDDNYARVMLHLERGRRALTESLVAGIEKLVTKGSWDEADVALYGSMLEMLDGERVSDIGSAKLFRGLHGRSYSPKDLFEAWSEDRRIFMQAYPTELTRRLDEAGIPVIFGQVTPSSTSFPWDTLRHTLVEYASRHAASSFLRWIQDFFDPFRARISTTLVVPRSVYIPVEVDTKPPAEFSAFLSDVGRVLRIVFNAPKAPIGTFRPLEQHDEMFLVTDARALTLKVPPLQGTLRDRDHISINREHPHVLKLLDLYAVEPEFAVYCMAKCLLLEEDRDLSADQLLMATAMGVR